jgi:hypothetical protein
MGQALNYIKTTIPLRPPRRAGLCAFARVKNKKSIWRPAILRGKPQSLSVAADVLLLINLIFFS